MSDKNITSNIQNIENNMEKIEFPSTRQNHDAAIKIQSIFLMAAPRNKFLLYIKEKGQYLAATMIQKFIRGYLCRKKLVPLIREIKKDLGSVLTRSDIETSYYELKTDHTQNRDTDYYGTNFDKIFANDKEDSTKQMAKRILSDAKAYEISKNNPFDHLKHKTKPKRSKWYTLCNSLVIGNYKSIKDSNFEEIEKEVKNYYKGSPDSYQNFQEIGNILQNYEMKKKHSFSRSSNQEMHESIRQNRTLSQINYDSEMDKNSISKGIPLISNNFQSSPVFGDKILSNLPKM